jgi:DNA modification methylase
MEQPDGWDTGEGSHGTIHRAGREKGKPNRGIINGRNKRSVWTVTTKPFKAAHFATFPPKLIEPCILAGCPLDGTVLDPFAGAGTTLLVASQHNRQSIGLELSEKYAGIARDRLSEVQPVMF